MNSLLFLSDGESEEDVVNLRIHRRQLRHKLDLLTMPDEEFVANFRINKRLFIEIHDKIARSIGPKHNRGLTALHKLAATLKFLAQGSYQRGVGNDFTIPIGQSTFSKVFNETLRVMQRVFKNYVSMDMSEEEKSAARRYFFEASGIPGIVMCVDGTHIKIIAPNENKELFFNRKGFYSLNALMICDHRNLIRYVDARFRGSNHDSYIFNASPVSKVFEEKWRNGERMFKLLADSAYQTKPWIIKPLRNVEPNSPEALFNEKQAKARSIIERTVGMLKNKFRCLLGARQLHYSPDKCVRIVNVCCILHNMCILNGQEDFNEQERE